MSRRMKKILSVICVMAMVTSSIGGTKLISVVADTNTTVITTSQTDKDYRAALLSEISDADYNFALNKNATVSNLTTGDGGTNLACITDGTFTTTNNTNTIIMIGKGSKSNAWVQVDLNKGYDTSKIDRIAVQYKTNNSGPKSGYYISYSLNGVDFVTVATVGAIAGSNNQIYLDKISLTKEQAEAIPYVRYIRVTSTTDNSSYGLQVKGMAVLTDGTTKVGDVGYQEVQMLDDASALTVTSSDYNQLEYSFTAAPNDNGTYVYHVYVNGIEDNNNAQPGISYVKKELPAGNYTVKVIAMTGTLMSNGISSSVVVTDTKGLLTGERNLATNKTARASSIRDKDVETSITDNVLNVLFRTATTESSASIVIDLEQNYRLDAIERAVGFYADNRYPTTYSVDYSLNGIDFETVATAEGNSTVQSIKISATECSLPAVRYVRFNLNAPVATGYGFQMYELGVIAKEGADLTPVQVENVDNPAELDVEITGYNKARVTITAGDGQENYKYNVYIDDELALRSVNAGTHTITDIAAGDRKFTAKSVLNGVISEGISVIKKVESALTYNYEALPSSVTEAGKTIETSKQVGNKEYNNYSLFSKATATASSIEGESYSAVKAIDGIPTTRWSSVSGEGTQWITVDLGDVYNICEMDIVWQTASAKNFDIEFSTDGTLFEKIGTIKDAAVGSRCDSIVLTNTTRARYVKINGTERTGVYGYSIWDMGIYGPDSENIKSCKVSIDGEQVAKVNEGSNYMLPTDSTYGYICGDKAYKAATEVTITQDTEFVSIGNLSVVAQEGAAIRFDLKDTDGKPLGGIRFMTRINAEEQVLNSAAISEGTLITANDLYIEKGKSELRLDSDYTKINIVNEGWYGGQTGTYCGSVVKIAESNWIREFIGRGYVTITYNDGTSTTIYSNMTGVRTIKGVAQAVINANYAGVPDEYKSVIDIFSHAR